MPPCASSSGLLPDSAIRPCSITTSREDIYGGKIVPFVPFTKLDGDKIVGTHNR